MRVEKHNAHGMQLVVHLSPEEVFPLIEKLFKVAALVAVTNVNHYATIPCEFEDNNDRGWVPTDFTLMVEGDAAKSEELGCQAAYPCELPVEAMGSIPAGPCDLQDGHKPHCIRRNARPDHSK